MCILCLFFVSKLFVWWKHYMNEKMGSFHKAYSYCRWGLRVIFFFCKNTSHFVWEPGPLLQSHRGEALCYAVGGTFHVKVIRRTGKCIAAWKYIFMGVYVFFLILESVAMRLASLKKQNGSWPLTSEFYVKATAQITSINKVIFIALAGRLFVSGLL